MIIMPLNNRLLEPKNVPIKAGRKLLPLLELELRFVVMTTTGIIIKQMIPMTMRAGFKNYVCVQKEELVRKKGSIFLYRRNTIYRLLNQGHIQSDLDAALPKLKHSALE